MVAQPALAEGRSVRELLDSIYASVGKIEGDLGLGRNAQKVLIRTKHANYAT